MTDQNKAGGEAAMDFLGAHEDVVKWILERQPADEYFLLLECLQGYTPPDANPCKKSSTE